MLENLSLDTKITFLLQLVQKLWNITEIQCEIGSYLEFFNGFCPFTRIIMVWHAA